MARVQSQADVRPETALHRIMNANGATTAAQRNVKFLQRRDIEHLKNGDIGKAMTTRSNTGVISWAGIDKFDLGDVIIRAAMEEIRPLTADVDEPEGVTKFDAIQVTRWVKSRNNMIKRYAGANREQ